MGKPHPVELRERVVSFVDEGHTHRLAAEHFRVSPRFVNDMIILRRETGFTGAEGSGAWRKSREASRSRRLGSPQTF